MPTGSADEDWWHGDWDAQPANPLTRETIMGTAGNATFREPWNKGKIVGQKAPFRQAGLKPTRAMG
jgi:hypothetical protein